MSLDKWKSDEKLVERMSRAIQSGSVSHAYIIAGDNCVDKEAFALDFLKAIGCEKRPGLGCPDGEQNSRDLQDVCLSCLKEMPSGGSRDDVEDAPVSVDESTIGLNSVSTMDEIIPEIEEDIPANEYGDIQNELSLESVIEDENEDEF